MTERGLGKQNDLPSAEEIIQGFRNVRRAVEQFQEQIRRNGPLLGLLSLQLTEAPDAMDRRKKAMDKMDLEELRRAQQAAVNMAGEIGHYLVWRQTSAMTEKEDG